MAYFVAQRRHEMGVRAALGAQRRDLLKLIIREGMKLTLVGVGIGLVMGLASTRALEGLPLGLEANHHATWLVTTLLLISAALLACYLPARRAAKVEPLMALREE